MWYAKKERKKEKRKRKEEKKKEGETDKRKEIDQWNHRHADRQYHRQIGVK